MDGTLLSSRLVDEYVCRFVGKIRLTWEGGEFLALIYSRYVVLLSVQFYLTHTNFQPILI